MRDEGSETPPKVAIYDSLEEENRAEIERRRAMTFEERHREMAVVMERRWGKDWTKKPIVKVARWEEVDW